MLFLTRQQHKRTHPCKERLIYEIKESDVYNPKAQCKSWKLQLFQNRKSSGSLKTLCNRIKVILNSLYLLDE